MNRAVRRLIIAGILAALNVACFGSAALAADKPTGPEAIKQTAPSYYVHADVDRPDRSYREGDSLTISVVCEADAHLYVLYKQADGKIYQIFPNSGQPDNAIKAKAKTIIPSGDDRFRWKVAAPFGKEIVKVIASKEPLPQLDDPAFRAKLFNAVPATKVKEVAAVLANAAAPDWTEDQVEIITHDKTFPPPAPGKRFGVFFGVGHYCYEDDYHLGTGKKDSLERSSNAADPVVLQKLLKRVGRLDDSRVFVNEQASRQAMEDAITGWLPEVSQPGDTVFIFFAGHGDALVNHATNHVRMAYLLPYDFAGTAMIAGLDEKKKAGPLSDEETALLDTWHGWLHDAKSGEQAVEIMARHTGVPDDEFGHWLQRLAGRQVVLLLGACHSGGFAEEGKDLLQRDVALEFLNQQIDRLNDLGQGEVALMAACGSKETSLSFHMPDDKLQALNASLKGAVEDELPKDVLLSVFNYCIVDSLLTDQAPIRLETTFERCRRGTVDYIERLNDKNRREGRPLITPYAPQLFNHCLRPVILKYQATN